MNKSKMLACLKLLGVKPKMESFSDRKKMQKITYLLPVFGIDIGLDINSYSWYLHGPYSPKLTETLFEIVENPDDVIVGELNEEEVEIVERVKKILAKDIESLDFLELLVSLHFLVQEAKKYDLGAEVAIEFLKKKKSYFSDKEIQYALMKVRMIK